MNYRVMKNILIIVYKFLMFMINIGGVIHWIELYNSGRYTEWWVFLFIIISALAAIIFATEFVKSIRS